MFTNERVNKKDEVVFLLQSLQDWRFKYRNWLREMAEDKFL